MISDSSPTDAGTAATWIRVGEDIHDKKDYLIVAYLERQLSSAAIHALVKALVLSAGAGTHMEGAGAGMRCPRQFCSCWCVHRWRGGLNATWQIMLAPSESAYIFIYRQRTVVLAG